MELADLARSCAKSARATTGPEVGYQLWQVALEYQEKAAELDDGKPPDIGEPPIMLLTRT
jgi:hypothetical protein